MAFGLLEKLNLAADVQLSLLPTDLLHGSNVEEAIGSGGCRRLAFLHQNTRDEYSLLPTLFTMT